MSPAIGIDIDVRWITVDASADDWDAAFLREARERSGLSRAEAAQLLGGMTEIEYAALEFGRRRFVDMSGWDAAALVFAAARKS